MLKGFGIRRTGDPNPVPTWIGNLLEAEFNIESFKSWTGHLLGLGVVICDDAHALHRTFKYGCIWTSEFSSSEQRCQSPEYEDRS